MTGKTKKPQGRDIRDRLDSFRMQKKPDWRSASRCTDHGLPASLEGEYTTLLSNLERRKGGRKKMTKGVAESCKEHRTHIRLCSPGVSFMT